MRRKFPVLLFMPAVALALWMLLSGMLVSPSRTVLAQPANAPYTDPCALLKWTYVPFSVAANTQEVAGVSGQNVFVCLFVVNGSATALTVNVVEGTGSTCGTGTVGMMGGATAATGASITTNGPGFVVPFTGRSAMQTATRGDSVCIFASAQVSGVFAFVQPALPF